jgi:hypothetical protein
MKKKKLKENKKVSLWRTDMSAMTKASRTTKTRNRVLSHNVNKLQGRGTSLDSSSFNLYSGLQQLG